jgi:hypothetical protein
MSSAAKPPILTVISKILESSNLVGTSVKPESQKWFSGFFMFYYFFRLLPALSSFVACLFFAYYLALFFSKREYLNYSNNKYT